MSDRDDGGPALVGLEMRDGVVRLTSQMSLRDYFAAAALTGMNAAIGSIKDPTDGRLAKWAYDQADAMLEERKKNGA